MLRLHSFVPDTKATLLYTGGTDLGHSVLPVKSNVRFELLFEQLL